MHAFNQSLSYDRRMYSADIRGSVAYSEALQRVGILTPEEQAKLASGLNQVMEEWQKGSVCPRSRGM